jgi:hypothetical protein
MRPPTEPYALTEADLLDLRVRMARVGFISDGVHGPAAAAPWITYVLSTREYALHSEGFTVAVTDRDDLACALLRSERIEPGFCRRVLDPLTPVDVALVTPEQRAAYHRDRNAEAVLRRLEREEAEAAARRRRSQLRPPDPLTITLEDLLS